MSTPSRVLVTGAGGQLGTVLQRAVPPGYEVVACSSTDLDITSAAAVAEAVQRHSPRAIVNAAAYTAVDRAEAEPERAWAVNAEGVAHLARAARDAGALLVHISTDFVFDGAQGRPYHPGDATAPLGVYGASKLGGERAVQAAGGVRATVIRTGWLYASVGRNFVRTMLALLPAREEIGVVADQVGSPTLADGLAEAIWAIVRGERAPELLHWSDAGVASWYDFALAIREEALASGVLARAAQVRPIRTVDYPTAARRPAYSVLDKTETYAALRLEPVHWRTQLRRALKELTSA